MVMTQNSRINTKSIHFLKQVREAFQSLGAGAAQVAVEGPQIKIHSEVSGEGQGPASQSSGTSKGEGLNFGQTSSSKTEIQNSATLNRSVVTEGQLL